MHDYAAIWFVPKIEAGECIIKKGDFFFLILLPLDSLCLLSLRLLVWYLQKRKKYRRQTDMFFLKCQTFFF